MIDLQTGLQNIIAGQGVPIAVAGMTIVFAALSIIAVFLTLLPRLLRWVAAVVPEPTPPAPRHRTEDDASLAAVAAAAYHAARGGKA